MRFFRLGVQKEADRPSEHGCCPLVQGIEAGGNFPVGLSSFRVLALWFLSQAWHLGGLHRASPVPFRGSSFTSGLHPPGATPQGLNACLYRHWGFPPISSMRFVAHSASFPTGVKEVLAMFALSHPLNELVISRKTRRIIVRTARSKAVAIM